MIWYDDTTALRQLAPPPAVYSTAHSQLKTVPFPRVACPAAAKLLSKKMKRQVARALALTHF